MNLAQHHKLYHTHIQQYYIQDTLYGRVQKIDSFIIYTICCPKCDVNNPLVMNNVRATLNMQIFKIHTSYRVPTSYINLTVCLLRPPVNLPRPIAEVELRGIAALHPVRLLLEIHDHLVFAEDVVHRVLSLAVENVAGRLQHGIGDANTDVHGQQFTLHIA